MLLGQNLTQSISSTVLYNVMQEFGWRELRTGYGYYFSGFTKKEAYEKATNRVFVPCRA